MDILKSAPRPPPGYASLAVEPSQILLQLTISNKCGQAFRWRGVDVYEKFEDVKGEETDNTQLSGVHVKSELLDEPNIRVKSEDDGEQIAPLRDNGSSQGALYRQTIEWSMCLSDRVVLLRQDEDRGYIYHRTVLGSNACAQAQCQSQVEIDKATAHWLQDYLNLNVPLEAMYDEWSAKDPVFKRFSTRFAGLRMLRQDPVECLFAFICSSNNNIARIGQMVQSLCTNYADPIASITYPPPPSSILDRDEDVKATSTTINFHPFPMVERLAHDDVESDLRKLMFGYRAKFIQDTARKLLEIVATSKEGGFDCMSAEGDQAHILSGKRFEDVASYLSFLRTVSYTDARQQLTQLNGVGPKVADCILLMSMDQPSSIPVDRHVFQFAEKWYRIRTKGGHKGYEHIADTFRKLWGEYAGWAHSVLFTADLRAFQSFKVEDGLNETNLKAEGILPLAIPAVKQEMEKEAAAGPEVLPAPSQYIPSSRIVSEGIDNGHTAPEVSAREARQQRRMERIMERGRELGNDATSRPPKSRKHTADDVRPERGGIKKSFGPQKPSRGRPCSLENGSKKKP